MNGTKFREAIKGYNRSDVNTYIESLSKQLSESEAGRKQLVIENTRLEKKLSEIEETQKGCKCESAGNIDTAKRIEELEAEIKQLKLKNEELSECQIKAELYDKMSAKLGDMLLHAGGAAEELIKTAEDEAKRISSEAEELKRTTTEKLRQMLEESNLVFKSMSEEALGALNVYNDETRKTLDDIAAALRLRSESMQNELEKSNRELYSRMIIDIDRIYGEAASVLKTENTASNEDKK